MAFPLLLLPRELRDDIYRSIFDQVNVYWTPPESLFSRNGVCPSIFLTCRQTYAEASEVFYTEGRFRAKVYRLWYTNPGVQSFKFDCFARNVSRMKNLTLQWHVSTYEYFRMTHLGEKLLYLARQGCSLRVLQIEVYFRCPTKNCTKYFIDDQHLLSRLAQTKVSNKMILIFNNFSARQNTEEGLASIRAFADALKRLQDWQILTVEGSMCGDYGAILQRPEVCTVSSLLLLNYFADQCIRIASWHSDDTAYLMRLWLRMSFMTFLIHKNAARLRVFTFKVRTFQQGHKNKFILLDQAQ